MWEPDKVPNGIPEKVMGRVRRLPMSDLTDWADQAICSTGRSLTAYQRDRVPEFLLEAQTGAQVLLAIVNEIRRRDDPTQRSE